MTGRIGRSVGASAIGILLAVSTSGTAAASVVDYGGSDPKKVQAAGERVFELRDQLSEVAFAGDRAR